MPEKADRGEAAPRPLARTMDLETPLRDEGGVPMLMEAALPQDSGTPIVSGISTNGKAQPGGAAHSQVNNAHVRQTWAV